MQILNSEQPSTVKKTGGSQPVPNNGHIEVTKKKIMVTLFHFVKKNKTTVFQ